MAGNETEGLLEQEEDTQKDKYLTFVIGKEFYGIDISFVTEIIGMQAITQVPELPEYIMGIINLRGKIIPVMDVRLRFKKPFNDYNDRTCIIVVDINELLVGLIVDSVSDVLTIAEEDIVPPPDMGAGNGSKYIKGIGKSGSDVKLLLDCEKLLNEDAIENLTNI